MPNSLISDCTNVILFPIVQAYLTTCGGTYDCVNEATSQPSHHPVPHQNTLIRCCIVSSVSGNGRDIRRFRRAAHSMAAQRMGHRSMRAGRLSKLPGLSTLFLGYGLGWMDSSSHSSCATRVSLLAGSLRHHLRSPRQATRPSERELQRATGCTHLPRHGNGDHWRMRTRRDRGQHLLPRHIDTQYR